MKKKIFLIGIVCVVLMFIGANFGDKIINEPIWLLLVAFILIGFLIKKPVDDFFYKKNDSTNSTNSNKFLIGIMWFSLSFGLTFSLLAPLRFAMVMAAKKNEEKIVVCDITRFHKTLKNKKKYLWYEFEGHSNKKKLSMSEYIKLSEGKNNKKYKLYLTVKKSILNTHIIQQYEIKE